MLRYGGRNSNDLIYGDNKLESDAWGDMYPDVGRRSPGPNIPNNPSNASLMGRPGTIRPAEPAVGYQPNPSNASLAPRNQKNIDEAFQHAGGRAAVDRSLRTNEAGTRVMGGSGSTPAVAASMIAASPSKPSWSPNQYDGSLVILQRELHKFDNDQTRLTGADRRAMSPDERKALIGRRQAMVDAIRGLHDERLLLNAQRNNPGPQFAQDRGSPAVYDDKGNVIRPASDDYMPAAQVAQRGSIRLQQQANDIVRGQMDSSLQPMSRGQYDANSLQQGRMAIYKQTGQWPTDQYGDEFVRAQGRRQPGVTGTRGAIDGYVEAGGRLAQGEQDLAYKQSQQYIDDYNSGPRQDARGSAIAYNNRINAGAVAKGEEMLARRQEAALHDRALVAATRRGEIAQANTKASFYEGKSAEQEASLGAARSKMKAGAGVIDKAAAADANNAEVAVLHKSLGVPSSSDFVKKSEPVLRRLKGAEARGDFGQKAEGQVDPYKSNLADLDEVKADFIVPLVREYKNNPTPAQKEELKWIASAFKRGFNKPGSSGKYEAAPWIFRSGDGDPVEAASRLQSIWDTLTAIENGEPVR